MLTHDAVWMSLEDAMLREANTRGPALHGVPLAGGTQRSRHTETGSRRAVARGWGRGNRS